MIYFWLSRVARSDVLYTEAISFQPSAVRRAKQASRLPVAAPLCRDLKLEARFEINTV